MDTENKDLIQETENTEEVEVTPGDFTTLDISREDLEEEMENFGIADESVEVSADDYEIPEEQKPRKKKLVQTPIIISAVAFVLVAAIVFGSVFAFNTFFKKSIDGAWTWTNSQEILGGDMSNIYFVFDKDGNVSMDAGGEKYVGTYTLEETEEGTVNFNSQFFYFGMLGGTGTYTKVSNKEMSLTFQSLELKFEKAELPEIEFSQKTVTHASADEFGITEVNIDKAILGSWTDESNTTFTFNKDGSGSLTVPYQYAEMYGYGYGSETHFRYTTYEDKILVSIPYYSGDTQDTYLTYGVNNGNLVINGIGYKPAE